MKIINQQKIIIFVSSVIIILTVLSYFFQLNNKIEYINSSSLSQQSKKKMIESFLNKNLAASTKIKFKKLDNKFLEESLPNGNGITSIDKPDNVFNLPAAQTGINKAPVQQAEYSFDNLIAEYPELLEGINDAGSEDGSDSVAASDDKSGKDNQQEKWKALKSRYNFYNGSFTGKFKVDTSHDQLAKEILNYSLCYDLQFTIMVDKRDKNVLGCGKVIMTPEVEVFPNNLKVMKGRRVVHKERVRPSTFDAGFSFYQDIAKPKKRYVEFPVKITGKKNSDNTISIKLHSENYISGYGDQYGELISGINLKLAEITMRMVERIANSMGKTAELDMNIVGKILQITLKPFLSTGIFDKRTERTTGLYKKWIIPLPKQKPKVYFLINAAEKKQEKAKATPVLNKGDF